jgi:hypothetical protein
MRLPKRAFRLVKTDGETPSLGFIKIWPGWNDAPPGAETTTPGRTTNAKASPRRRRLQKTFRRHEIQTESDASEFFFIVVLIDG